MGGGGEEGGEEEGEGSLRFRHHVKVPYHLQSQVINVSKLICFYKRLSDQNHSDLDV